MSRPTRLSNSAPSGLWEQAGKRSGTDDRETKHKKE